MTNEKLGIEAQVFGLFAQSIWRYDGKHVFKDVVMFKGMVTMKGNSCFAQWVDFDSLWNNGMASWW